MSLAPRIFSCPKKSDLFSAFFLAILLFHAPMLSAQKQARMHRQAVAASAASASALRSMDTLYCSGKAIARIGTGYGAAAEEYFMPLSVSDPHIIVRRVALSAQGQTRRYFHHFSFPGLHLSCYAAMQDSLSSPYDQICRYELMNVHGLDTMRAEMFVTLKGGNKTPPFTNGLSSDTQSSEKSLVLPRDKNAALLFSEDKIAQGGVLIGTFKEAFVDGPAGSIRQLLVYNSTGALICTASKGAKGSGKKVFRWSLLTYKDNRFSELQLSEEKELEHLLRHLIGKGLL